MRSWIIEVHDSKANANIMNTVSLLPVWFSAFSSIATTPCKLNMLIRSVVQV